MNAKQINRIREKVMKNPVHVHETKVFQYWIDSNGHLQRARLENLDTMEMYKPGAIETLD